MTFCSEEIGDSTYEADGAVSYAWSAGGGSFAAATNRSTNWTAPNTLGKYTLSCKIDDPHADGHANDGTTYLVRSADELLLPADGVQSDAVK